jgi:NACHT domain
MSSVDQQNRLRLLKQVRETWVRGVLEQSLYQGCLIELNLQEQPDALDNPWHLEVQETNRPPRLLPVGTTILQVYDQANGELLILGAPGSGKTTLLLELLRDLLERALQDEQHLIPVMFYLSSWIQARQPLAEWMVEELRTKYRVPRKIGQHWINTHQILPLLDGLDEVMENERSACVQQINMYQQNRLAEQGIAPLVACCRSQEYMAQPTRVTLQQAVSIQRLADEQIEGYLQRATGQLEGLRHALRHDPELYKLAQCPLMLNIFTLAYKEAAPEDLPGEGTENEKQQQIFTTYVERMLKRRKWLKRWKQEQVIPWLAFLAKQMQRDGQTLFSVENLQPDWLPKGEYGYPMLLNLLVSQPVGWVLGPLVALLTGSWFNFVYGPAIGLILGQGALGTILHADRIEPAEAIGWSWKKMWLIFALSTAVLVGLTVGQVQGLPTVQPVFGLPAGAFLGVVAGLTVVGRVQESV